jgi:hypothetical protein
MLIRLSKEAPWEEVTFSDGKINKHKWIDENSINYKSIKKWIEFKEDKVVEQIKIEEIKEETINKRGRKKSK